MPARPARLRRDHAVEPNADAPARRAARRRRRSLPRDFPLIVVGALMVALVMKIFMAS
ncbi:hypothetical protein [Streptomyces sp. NPDC014734]|uniref:hypothetical protein n=1 Tax=Streptomyces sp. NPDC014734 TaxID=3364886 RepID=UPI0036F6422B